MIIFETLKYKNLLSAGNLYTTIELNSYPSTLVIGKNGAGKSTVLDALCFALFAKPFRNINKPQLVNSINKKNLLVELTFSIGKTKYKIIRGIKPATFEVYQNGKLLNQSADQKDYQEILEKQILKLNYKSFRQIVILGSASFVPFMALTTGQRREIIEDLLDLQIFTTMNNLLKERIASNTKTINDIIARQDLTREKIDLYNKHMVQMQRNNEEIIVNKQELIDQTSIELVEFKKQSDNYEQNIQLLSTRLSERKDQTNNISKIERLLNKLNVEKNAIQRDLLFFAEHMHCPTCMQNINEDFRNETIKEKQKLVIKYEKGIVKALDQQHGYNLLQTGLNSDKENIARLKNEQAQIFAEVRSKAFYIQQLINDIETINKQNSNYSGERIDELSEELKRAEIEYQEALDDKQTFVSAALLLKDGGIKAKIIKQYVPVINKLINKYLSALDFFVQFELNEAFEESIKSRYRDEFSYESFSEGEKKRINLAIIFTWRAIAKLRNSANTNLFMLDEVFDSSLDLTGMEEVLQLLLSLSADNTFIISHNQATVADKFTHVIKFEKRNNFSKIANDSSKLHQSNPNNTLQAV